MCAFQWSLWKARLITWPREPDKQSELTNDGIMPRHSGRRWWWAGDNATTSRTHSSKKKGVETRGGRERERERGNGREKEKYKKRRGEKGKQSSLFLPISSRFGGYPRVPTATPHGPANLVQDDCRPANPLIPFHLSIANVRSVPACTLHYYSVLCA